MGENMGVSKLIFQGEGHGFHQSTNGHMTQKRCPACVVCKDHAGASISRVKECIQFPVQTTGPSGYSPPMGTCPRIPLSPSTE